MKPKFFKNTSIYLVLGAFLTLSLVAPLASAHTTVKSTTLEDGGVYQTMPDVFDLVFAQKVGLASLNLKNEDGESIEMNFTPPKSMETKFAIPMPVLKSGLYKMTWRAVAKDGHILKGDISFTVK